MPPLKSRDTNWKKKVEDDKNPEFALSVFTFDVIK